MDGVSAIDLASMVSIMGAVFNRRIIRTRSLRLAQAGRHIGRVPPGGSIVLRQNTACEKEYVTRGARNVCDDGFFAHFLDRPRRAAPRDEAGIGFAHYSGAEVDSDRARSTIATNSRRYPLASSPSESDASWRTESSVALPLY